MQAPGSLQQQLTRHAQANGADGLSKAGGTLQASTHLQPAQVWEEHRGQAP